MKQKSLRLRTSQKRYTDESALNLSKLIRNALDDAMMGKREYPNGHTRRAHDDDYERTSVLIDEHHDFFIQDNDLALSQYVDEVVQDRIEVERKLNEIDE